MHKAQKKTCKSLSELCPFCKSLQFPLFQWFLCFRCLQTFYFCWMKAWPWPKARLPPHPALPFPTLFVDFQPQVLLNPAWKLHQRLTFCRQKSKMQNAKTTAGTVLEPDTSSCRFFLRVFVLFIFGIMACARCSLRCTSCVALSS